MGGMWSRSDSPDKEGTALVEMIIPHMNNAHDLVSADEFGNQVPLVIRPRNIYPSCCCVPCCCVSIPEGFGAIVSAWSEVKQGDQEDGSYGAGMHCFLPWWNVDRLVNKQICVFDTPVRGCKTKDNIYIHLDVLITFSVFESITFMHNLGPDSLDSLLRATQEEFLKTLAEDTNIEDIYDLYGSSEKTKEYLRDMSASFGEFGVKIHDFTVRNVTIPQAMAADFEAKTLYDSQEQETKVELKKKKLDLNNQEARTKLQDEISNNKMAEEEQSIKETMDLVKETNEVNATVVKDVAMFNCEGKAEAEDLLANCELEVARVQAAILKLEMETEANVNKETEVLENDAKLFGVRERCRGKAEAAEKINAGKKKVAEAEGRALKAFAPRREQEQEMKRLELLELMANNDKVRIVTSQENDLGLAPGNALVTQVAQQGLEAARMGLAQMTASAAEKLKMKPTVAGGLVRPQPQRMS